ncbi:MAG: diguanylate cyclase, partial [Alphaproteobacteria bacterium]
DIRTATGPMRLVAAIDTLEDSLVMYDADDRLVLANQAWWKDRHAAGISPPPNSTYEENMRDLLAAGHYPEAQGQEEAWSKVRMDRRRNPSSPFEIETDDSSWRLVTDHHLADGGIMTIITDITAQKRAEEAAEMLRIVTRLSNETISIEDAARRSIVAVCDYARWPVGHLCLSYNDEPGSVFACDVWHIDDTEHYRLEPDAASRPIGDVGCGMRARVIETGAPTWAVDMCEADISAFSCRDPDFVLATGFAFPVFVGDDVGAVLEFYAPEARADDADFPEIMKDVGGLLGRVLEREKAKTKSVHDTSYDRLTGLPNRALGMDRLALAVNTAAANDSMLALLFLDLDGFKKVNDSLGHGTGDRLLQEAAQRLQSNIRADDTVMYWGGATNSFLSCPARSPRKPPRLLPGACSKRVPRRINWMAMN